MNKQFFSIAELAEILGISRIAIYKKVKSGAIKSKRMGKAFFIPASYVHNITGKTLSEAGKKLIDESVMKTINEYGETLKKLGKRVMKNITAGEVEYLSFKLAKEGMDFNEPIPDFSTRFPNVLERCLAAPYQTFGSKYLYRGLIGKASILFYSMIKNHPFQNGNKRIAMTTLFTFLYLNNKWISIDNQSLYNFTIWVASSPSDANTHVIKAISDFINKYIKNLK